MVLLLLAAPGLLAAETQPVSFAGGEWELSGADGKVETFLGQSALRIRTGRAVRRDVSFEDGTIEFDLALTPHRAFAYLQFRVQGDGEYEDIYFRSHKSGLPDAVQYTPVYQGASSWQLYHGKGHTAAAPLPQDVWIHVKVVVKGQQAAVFVGETDEPQMVVPRLARKAAPGQVALRGFLPGGRPAGVYTTSFANFVVRPGEVTFDFSALPPAEDSAPPGVVTHWSLSPAFAPPEGALRELPAGLMESDSWKVVQAEPSGLLPLLRDVPVPEGSRRPGVLARIVVRAAEAGTRRFDFGYSDQVSVFLNGTLLFSGDNGYSFNFPRRQGLITLDQNALYLPLHAGENELVLAVAEVFGGWGLMGRFEDPAGLEVSAR